MARRMPRWVESRFWDGLSQRPLSRPLGAARSPADLAHAHLREVLSSAGGSGGRDLRGAGQLRARPDRPAVGNRGGRIDPGRRRGGRRSGGGRLSGREHGRGRHRRPRGPAAPTRGPDPHPMRSPLSPHGGRVRQPLWTVGAPGAMGSIPGRMLRAQHPLRPAPPGRGRAAALRPTARVPADAEFATAPRPSSCALTAAATA